MAGREKKTKNLSNTNASRESPTASKQTTLLSYIISEGAEAMNPNSSGAESPAAPGRKGAKPKGRPVTKKLNPNTKINTLRGRKKTKANFKLNIIKTQGKQNPAAKSTNKRGRPPLKKAPVKESPDKSDKTVDDESPPLEDPGAKRRGRKRGTTNEGIEDKVTDSPEVAKPSTKDSENKKTVMKNIPKKVVKRKQLIVAQKGITKKKLLLAKQILKTDAKQVDPKVLKKNLTAKLKSVSEKLEAKKDLADKEPVEVVTETNEPVIPLVEIKKEPELLEIPTSVPNSRSSSPRSASFRKRNSADLSVINTKNVLTDIPAVPAVIKSPYSTRSERSRSPFPAVGENATKPLRNGRPRKAKGGLKNDLLSETIGQEFKKRRRLLSDSKLGDLSPETLDELKKVKRLRSYSRDGSEISKCSDITESDLSFCDTMSIDTEHSKTLDNKEDFKEIKSQSINLEDIKTEISSPESSPVTAKVQVLEPDMGAASNTPKASATVDNVQNKGDSMDNENNNTDEKIKTDALLVSEKLSIDDAIDALDALEESLKVSLNEKKAEKSLILDNMSKTFNDSSLSSKAKSIRRSARQRKSTVKAKEQEETEKDVLESDLSAAKIVKADPDNISTCSSLSESVSDVTKAGKDDDLSSKPVDTDNNSSKITTKKFYGDSSNKSEDVKSDILTTTAEPDIREKSVSPKATDEISATSDASQDGDEIVKLHFDEEEEHEEVPVNDSLKTSYSNKAFSHQDIDKLIDKLRNFEELDKKRQEEKSVVAEKGSVMVTNDVVLIPKSNIEVKALKDLPNSTTLEKAKDSVLSCFENNSAISIVKKETSRKSFDIELPSSVTLIKRTGTSSRKHSTGSTNSKDNEVSMIDKTLGKDVTFELRKSIDKGILSLETTLGATKSSTISTGNGQSISISFKPQPVANAVKDCVTVTPSLPSAIITQVLPVPSNPVTALISLPTPLLITPVPLGSSITPVANSADAIAPATITPIVPAIPSLITTTTTTPPTISSDIPKTLNALKLLNTQLIPETPSLLAKTNSVPSALTIVPSLTILPSLTVPTGQTTTTTISPTFIKTSSELTITAEVTTAPLSLASDLPSITKTLIPKSDTVKKVSTLPIMSIPAEKAVKKVPETVATLASITLPLVSSQVDEKKASTSPPPPVILPLTESPEKQKQKEKILRTLGLLTLKEADEAKLEKQKQKELLIKANMPKTSTNNDGYTGTLKTVIKINRTSPDKKKSRSPLKMTFQKSKSRGSKLVSDGASGDSESDDSPHYTIHKEFGGASGGLGGAENHVTSGGQRKSHYSNRFNNHELTPADPLGEVAVEAAPASKEAVSLVIPEKASSFAIHPGRLCLDQCFYCGGKFGLFDTPCHVAQIKSRDRQKKILDNEEKLTVDSCLCDACYRHVDRRANCPGYRRRAIGSAGPLAAACPPGTAGSGGAFCHANTCRRLAPHSLRRKWLVKMRGNVSKVVQLDLDYPGLHTIPLCDVHYQAISHLMVCGLCKRGLSRNHVHYINQEYQALNPLISGMGLPVVFQERPVVCKLCRYFCTLLLRPPSNHQLNKKAFLTTYHRRLLLAHNLEIPAELEREVHLDVSASEAKKDQTDSIKEKKKGKTGKNKTKKSMDVRKFTEDMNSVKRAANAENLESNKKDKSWEDRNSLNKTGHNIPKGGLEEDIESLISTNTIPIPNANSKAGSHSGTPVRPTSEVSDNSDSDMMIDYDNPLISALDKQSELQYLLQKCNVPASTILQRGPISNLTQKSRNILKVHNAPAISKSSINQKIMDKNARRIQKLGQIITKNSDIEKALSGKLPNRDEFTIEAANNQISDATGLNMLRNIVLNDECTIETIPPKPSSKSAVDFNSLKSKLQMSDSFTQIKKNLKALSSRLSDDPQKKKKSEQRDSRYSNPVRRLETNPSISVRELFPGEEEMNLHCAIEFGNVKGITPEGWEKCSTTIQYDTDTKKLWHELQKPYGNQSSFLRHLILLEKYFRNGDLILANNANCNAATYSESVQNRLRSYDNIPSNGDTVHLPYTGSLFPKNSSLTVVQHTASPPPLLPPETVLESVPSKKSESSSLIEFRRHKTTSAAGKSLLKTNQSMEHPKMQSHKGSANHARPLDSFLPPSVNHAKIPKNVPISIAQINQSVDQAFNASKIPKNVPLSLSQLEKLSNQLPQMHVPATPRPPTPRPDGTKSTEFIRPPSLPSSIAIETKVSHSKPDSIHNKPRAPSLPPELIAINSQHSTQKKSMDNVLKNIQQLAKGSSTPVNHFGLPPSLQTPGMSPISSAHEIPTLPAEPTTKKSKGSSKQWRPTLIPITDESKLRNARDVLYQTADGRRLPSLVQVMSGGKPYHITIQDYNRMCVMRREKLQQMQRAELSKKSSGSATTLMHGISLDPSLDLPIQPVLPVNKPASPNTALPDIPNVQSLTNSKNTDQVSPIIVKTSQSKTEALPEKTSPPPPPNSVPDVSLLKNVSLKHVSIAPIASLSPPNSLLITAVSLPSIISQLGSSISVTTELTPTPPVVAVAPMASLSISPLLPKMPSSLTVTPSPPPSVTPPKP